MLYIHQLNHLTPKNAELESVYLVRELKQQSRYPLEEHTVRASLEKFRIEPQELEIVKEVLLRIEPTAEKITHLLVQRDPAHEPVNLQRATKSVKELQEPLQRNLVYFQEIVPWQQVFGMSITSLLNALPKLRTAEEKVVYNQKLKEIFSYLLRNKEFFFNFSDIIGEGQLDSIRRLVESMGNGFFFRVSLEEELKKLEFKAIKMRLSAEQLAATEDIQSDLVLIREGIEKAYELNMRQVKLAVNLFAYVKWMMNL